MSSLPLDDPRHTPSSILSAVSKSVASHPGEQQALLSAIAGDATSATARANAIFIRMSLTSLYPPVSRPVARCTAETVTSHNETQEACG